MADKLLNSASDPDQGIAPLTSPQKSGKKPLTVSTVTGIILITIIIFATIIICGATNMIHWPTSQVETANRTKHIIIDDQDWHGFVNMDPTKKVRATIATADEDVYYRLRIDYNDKLIFTNPPVMWKTNRLFRTPAGRSIEWMLLPGQAKKEASMIVQLLPRD